jgi:hypothetical protein
MTWHLDRWIVAAIAVTLEIVAFAIWRSRRHMPPRTWSWG